MVIPSGFCQAMLFTSPSENEEHSIVFDLIAPTLAISSSVFSIRRVHAAEIAVESKRRRFPTDRGSHSTGRAQVALNQPDLRGVLEALKVRD
jgi:hypothetical protein